MILNKWLQNFGLLVFISMSSSVKLTSGKDDETSLFLEEKRLFFPKSHHLLRRSNLQKRSSIGFLPSGIQRAIPENVPTAYVHTSLGEFKEIPGSLQQISSLPQKRENSYILKVHDAKVIPQQGSLFDIVNVRDVGLDSQILTIPKDSPLHQDFHESSKTDNEVLISEEITPVRNNFPTFGPSQIHSFPYINTRGNPSIDEAEYTLNEEELPLEEELAIHSTNSEDPEGLTYLSEALKYDPPLETSLGSDDLDSNSLLNNHNLEDAFYVDYPDSSIVDEQHGGHILHEAQDVNGIKGKEEDPSKKTSGTVNQDELVDGNLEQKNSPNVQMNVLQEGGKALIQKLEPTIILSNVSPYEVEPRKVVYPLLPLSSFNTKRPVAQQPQQLSDFSQENNIKLIEKEETEKTVTSLDSETFPSHGTVHTVNTIRKTHSFIPSYFGQSLNTQESQLVPRGRSLGGFEAEQSNTRFIPGKLEGGFVPSNFFKSLILS